METISRGFRSSQEVFGTVTGSTNSRPKIARIRDASGITAMGKLALLILHSREPNIFPSMQLLASNMNVSISTAKRAVGELERAGYLRVTHRNRQTNLYSITVAGDPIPLSPMTPKQVTHDPPSSSPMTPKQVTHDPPSSSPMTPQVAREVYKIRSKRESKSTRSLPPSNHVLRKTLICPKCERAWPEGLTGSACSNCHMEIATIQRRMDEGKRVGKEREISYEERVAELEAISREMKAREQAKKQSKAKPPVKKPQAEEPTKESEEDCLLCDGLGWERVTLPHPKGGDYQAVRECECTGKEKHEKVRELEEVEAGIQEARKELFDIVGKTYDAKLQEHLAQGQDGGKP